MPLFAVPNCIEHSGVPGVPRYSQCHYWPPLIALNILAPGVPSCLHHHESQTGHFFHCHCPILSQTTLPEATVQKHNTLYAYSAHRCRRHQKRRASSNACQWQPSYCSCLQQHSSQENARPAASARLSCHTGTDIAHLPARRWSLSHCGRCAALAACSDSGCCSIHTYTLTPVSLAL